MLPIQQSKSVLTMSSQEISALVNSRHDSVKRSVERLASLGTIQLPPLVEVKNGSGQTVEVYMIGKRDSYIVVAQLSPEFTAALVDRWQELESSNHQAIPKSFAEALQLAANQAAELEAARPAVAFVEKYVESTGNMGFRQVAKLLRIKENDFRAFLQDNKIMYRLGSQWMPYATHIDSGRFYVTTGTSDTDHAYSAAKFTPKGVEWVSKLLAAK